MGRSWQIRSVITSSEAKRRSTLQIYLRDIIWGITYDTPRSAASMMNEDDREWKAAITSSKEIRTSISSSTSQHPATNHRRYLTKVVTMTRRLEGSIVGQSQFVLFFTRRSFNPCSELSFLLFGLFSPLQSLRVPTRTQLTIVTEISKILQIDSLESYS